MGKYLHDNQLIWVVVALLIIFITGYFFRSYYQINFALDASPYEAFELRADGSSNFWADSHFTDKLTKYPTKIFFKTISDRLFGDFYIIFLLGFVGIFLLGWEVTQKISGGILATIPYALTSENLFAYTKTITINDSGLSYALIYWFIWSLLRLISRHQQRYLWAAGISGLIILTSYHTAASALVAIAAGLLISLFTTKRLTLQAAALLGGLIVFHVVWLLTFDTKPTLFELTINAVTSFAGIVAIGLLIVSWFVVRKEERLFSGVWCEIVPPLAIIAGVVIMFFPYDILRPLFGWNSETLYVSQTTLQHTIGQIILLHAYLLYLIPKLCRQQPDDSTVVLGGWAIGIGIIAVGFIGNNFFQRTFDYSFPLTFILFAAYWSGTKRGHAAIILATIVILIVSQLTIFHDPFSLRRYYTAAEINSAQQIINLQLSGMIRSDLRTAALFQYLGFDGVAFTQAHQKDIHDRVFYAPNQMIPAYRNSYVILTLAMRHVVYSTNFPTQPISQDVLDYYDTNFEKIYDDSTFTVYNVRRNDP